MNKTIGVQLLVYSLLLGGLSYLVHHLAPSLAKPTLIAGLAGGALCLLWGMRAIAGSHGKALPMLTLIVVNFVMLSQTIVSWTGTQEEAGRRPATWVITLLLALSVAMLIRIAWAGVVFGAQAAGPAKAGETQPRTVGKPAPKTNAARPA